MNIQEFDSQPQVQQFEAKRKPESAFDRYFKIALVTLALLAGKEAAVVKATDQVPGEKPPVAGTKNGCVTVQEIICLPFQTNNIDKSPSTGKTVETKSLGKKGICIAKEYIWGKGERTKVEFGYKHRKTTTQCRVYKWSEY